MFKPLLAKEVDLNKLRFPVYVSPKLDGIRCTILDGKPVSRTLKPIPNKHVRELLESSDLPSLDGELIVGLPNSMNTMQVTSSGIMSHGGTPDFTYYVFDHIMEPYAPFKKRISEIREASSKFPSFVKVLDHELVHYMEELEDYEKLCIEAGFEGIMIRKPDGHYKFGRSTINEAILLKMKRFVDEEAFVIGFEEKMHNANEQLRDARGYAIRSSHQDNLVPAGTLGALIVYSEKWGSFNIGTGFDDSLRLEIWNNQDKYLGLPVTFKYQSTGIKDKPRTPVFKSFRHKWDMESI